MFCWQRIKAVWCIVFNFILSFHEKFLNFISVIYLIIKHFCRFGSDNDFILRVAPLRDKTKDYYRNYFPPPLYGIPPNKKNKEGKQYEKYGLFLWPDYLYVYIRYYFWLLLLTIVPFLYLYKYIGSANNLIYYAIVLLIIIAILIRVLFILLSLNAPPVLNKVWALWPESQYQRFLTVPHLTDLHRSDKKKDSSQYWKPDESLGLSHQPMFYRIGKNTLQEIILSLAIFDFLFQSKNDIGEDEAARKSLKIQGWFYLFSPAIISYFLLMLAFFISAYFYPTNLKEFCPVEAYYCNENAIPALLRLPYFYVFLVVTWSILTFRMIMRQMNFLEKLQKEVREGRYDVHLELIPQQILNVVSTIPSDKQISKGIEKIETMLRFVQAGALASFFMLLEIFSSAFSS